MEVDLVPGDVIDIPPGHDAWVVGDEAVDFYSFKRPVRRRMRKVGLLDVWECADPTSLRLLILNLRKKVDRPVKRFNGSLSPRNREDN